jgi:hypothetical protein
MATFDVDVGGATYEVDAPDEKTAWKWANATHAKSTPAKPEYVTGHNLAMGALKSAADIGTTLLRPIDAALNFTGITDKTNVQRKADINQFFGERADPESLEFKGGELLTDIAGTAGIGGILSKAAKGLGAGPKIVNALQSGGFNLGGKAAGTPAGKAADMALRVGAGAAGGGAAAGLVGEDAGTGAMIGGGLPIGVKAAGLAGSGLRSAGEHILGKMTGTSAETLREAFKAGKTGADDFLKNMRGQIPFDDIVNSAKEGLRTMRQERGNAYRSGMVDIKGDKSILDMTPIAKAVSDIKASGLFKGKVINQKAGGTIDEIAAIVDDWVKSNADEFHTPEGLDALKQAIGDIRDSTDFSTPARRAADNVYNAVKSQIEKQAPKYSEVMKDYAEASQTIKEIEKALSLGEKASKDTAMRKLQSLMRNNANTNYGNRLDLAKQLEQRGNVSLNPAIAGQALSSWTPRGMQGLVTGGAVPAAALMGSPVAGLALAAGSSPRLIGEMAYGAGRMAGAGRNALASATQGAIPAGSQNALSEQIMANPVLRNALIQMQSR